MTDRHPLFEFMPYGAPELLVAHRRDLVRALALASGLAAAAFLIARMGGWSVSLPVIVDVPALVERTHTMTPPPSITAPATPRVAIVTRRFTGSVPVVVDDEVVVPQAPPPSFAGDGSGADVTPGASSDAGGEPAGGGAVAPGDDVPELGTYVYTDQLPVAAKIVEPSYPDLALDIGIGGRVYVFMLVGRDGRVVRAEVDPKHSVPLLDEAAVAAARRWVFQPALVNGHPIPVWVGQAFVFTPRR